MDIGTAGGTSVASSIGRSQRAPSRARVAVVGSSGFAIKAIESLLVEDGYSVLPCVWSQDAECFADVAVNLILLDLETPGAVGHAQSRLSSFKSHFSAPVLCLLPLSDQLDAGAVVQLGADDHLFKPVRPFELSSRIRILLQRSNSTGSGVPLIERRRGSRRQEDRTPGRSLLTEDRCRIDDASKSVVLDGRELHLSPKEYELFRLLASEVGRIFSVEEIIPRIWHDISRASAGDVHQYMHLLRRKVERNPRQRRWIVTVKGFGYKLEIPAEP